MFRLIGAFIISAILAIVGCFVLFAGWSELTMTWRTSDGFGKLWVIFIGYLVIAMVGLWGFLLPWATFWSRDPEIFEQRSAGKILSASIVAFTILAALASAPSKNHIALLLFALLTYLLSIKPINWEFAGDG